MKTYEARRRIGLKLKIKQDQTGFSKVVHNTALDPVHTPTPQQSSQPAPQTPFEAAASHPKSQPATAPLTTVIRTQPPAAVAASSVSVVTAQCNPALRSNPPPTSASSSSTSHGWPLPAAPSQVNGTLDHHDAGGGGGPKQNCAAGAAPSQTTCRLPLRKTYRENVSPRVRPGVPGGGDEGVAYPRPVLSPPRHGASSPPAERTVIASVKVEKRGRDAVSHAHAESGHDAGRLGGGGGGVQGLDDMDEMFGRGVKGSHAHDKEGGKERGEEQHADQETSVSKYKRASGKHRHGAGGTFRMDQHAPGPPSPDDGAAFARDSLLPAKRCKSDSPDMDNASFSSGSPPDDSLNEHLQCAIDSILNLQQEPPAGARRHLKAGGGRSHQHQSQRPGGTAAPSHIRPSHPPASSAAAASASSSLGHNPQVGGRGHNGGLVPQTQSR